MRAAIPLGTDCSASTTSPLPPSSSSSPTERGPRQLLPGGVQAARAPRRPRPAPARRPGTGARAEEGGHRLQRVGDGEVGRAPDDVDDPERGPDEPAGGRAAFTARTYAWPTWSREPRPARRARRPRLGRALAPVADRVAAHGGVPARRGRRRPRLPARRPTRCCGRSSGRWPRCGCWCVGQDPYPTPGHAVGLSFSVGPGGAPAPPQPGQRLPGAARRPGGGPRARTATSPAGRTRGCCCSTGCSPCGPGAAGSHRGPRLGGGDRGGHRGAGGPRRPAGGGAVGRPGARRCARCSAAVPVVASAHPSPLSASRGFFGSRPFSRVDALLAEQGAAAVDWRLR